MNVEEMMERIIVTKDEIDEMTGEYIVTDYKVKSTDGYLEQLKKFYKEERGTGYALPWSKLESNFGIRKGELTVFTGVSGHGKSMMLSQISLYLMHMTKVLIASMEMKPVLTLSRMVQQKLGDPNPTEKYLEEFCEHYKDKLYIYDQQGVTNSDDMVCNVILWKICT